MNIDIWMEKYYWITRELGINTEKDRYSTQKLSSIIKDKFVKQNEISKVIENRNVLVIGFGKKINYELSILSSIKHLLQNTVIVVADKAINNVYRYGLKIDFFITDLDCDKEYLYKLSRETVIVVHSHGDNIDKIESIIPEFLEKGYRIHATTQIEPLWNVFNYGGFTDGDRAVYFTIHYKPRRLVLIGMDYDKLLDKEIIDKYYSSGLKLLWKIKKLEIAEKLLEDLVCKSNIETYILSKSNIKCLVKINSDQLLLIIRE